MSKIVDIPSPTQREAKTLASDFGLKNHGLRKLDTVYWNLPTPALYEEAVFRGEGAITHAGPFRVDTGAHRARSAKDKYIVREHSTEDDVWWGEYNRPMSEEKFNSLLIRLQAYLQGEDLFVQDVAIGADPEYQMPLRIITERAWHSLFVRNMFPRSSRPDDLKRHIPSFTIIDVPSFQVDPRVDGTATETAIVVNFAQRLCLICGSSYAGEIKKSAFSVNNFLLPYQGVLPMHCSANVGADGDVALFFGLSGTGKTTLSADPKRFLIGDDEHGWSDSGVFNFEGGCYAKAIRLSAEHEPEIHACTQRFGTILENVVIDRTSRRLDLDDDALTENTRLSYPLHYIPNAVPEMRAESHPTNIFLLTCDASGVMPPIARLTPDQALYHFISGYTSKIAGTEVGLGLEPEITFSACFGAPFMVHHPYHYGDMLRKKMQRHGSRCWLVNTGWTGGPFGVGRRISIRHTRALLNAALEGVLDQVEFRTDPVFGFEVPRVCPGVPENVLEPSKTWGDAREYDRKYDALAARFIENFKLFASGCPDEIVNAGPRR